MIVRREEKQGHNSMMPQLRSLVQTMDGILMSDILKPHPNPQLLSQLQSPARISTRVTLKLHPSKNKMMVRRGETQGRNAAIS